MKWPAFLCIFVLAWVCGCSQEKKAGNANADSTSAVPAHCEDAAKPEAYLDTLNEQVAHQPTGYERWIGCPIQMLTSHWGVPNRQVNMPGGSAVLHWEISRDIPQGLQRLNDGSIYNPGPKHEVCAGDVTVDQHGTILGIVAVPTGISLKECQIISTSGPQF